MGTIQRPGGDRRRDAGLDNFPPQRAQQMNPNRGVAAACRPLLLAIALSCCFEMTTRRFHLEFPEYTGALTD